MSSFYWFQVRAYNDHSDDDDAGADDEVPDEAEPPVKGKERRPEKVKSRHKSRKIKVEEEGNISESGGGDEGAAEHQAEPSSSKGNKRPLSMKEEKAKERKAAKKRKKVKIIKVHLKRAVLQYSYLYSCTINFVINVSFNHSSAVHIYDMYLVKFQFIRLISCFTLHIIL